MLCYAMPMPLHSTQETLCYDKSQGRREIEAPREIINLNITNIIITSSRPPVNQRVTLIMLPH